uniref:Uncharacterized protein n=1 Tax=Ditylenchus dipsaci TaxID=166011 RepID=A0A915DD45_9BILA
MPVQRPLRIPALAPATASTPEIFRTGAGAVPGVVTPLIVSSHSLFARSPVFHSSNQNEHQHIVEMWAGDLDLSLEIYAIGKKQKVELCRCSTLSTTMGKEFGLF